MTSDVSQGREFPGTVTLNFYDFQEMRLDEPIVLFFIVNFKL